MTMNPLLSMPIPRGPQDDQFAMSGVGLRPPGMPTNATNPAPARQGSPLQMPTVTPGAMQVQPRADNPNPLAGAFQSFARGFAPQQTQAVDERHKADAAERMNRALNWMKQTAAQPADQRAAFTLQSAQDIARETGQSYEAVVASARDPNAFSDQVLNSAIAKFQGQLGIAPEKPAGPDYQFLQGPDGGVSRGDKTSGDLVQLQPGTPKPVDPKAPPMNNFGQMWDGQKWVDVPGALDNYRRMHPEKPAGGEGSGLTPYQQIQVDRQAAADAAKTEETDRQKQINIASLKDGMSRVDQFLGSKGFEGLYGTSWLGPAPTFGNAKPENVMNQDELNSMAMLNQIGGEAFLAGVAKMRGTGPLSDNEGKRVMAAVQRLTDRRQDKTAALAAAAEFKSAMDALVKVYEQESGGAAVPGAVQQPQGQPNMLDAAGQFIGNLFGGGQRQGGQPQPAPRPAAQPQARPQQQSTMQPGTIDVDDDTGEQYRFKGGDPTDQRNWEPVR
jgi:hypothetical protein